MFLRHRPQHSSLSIPRLSAKASALTTPARPSLQTSDSVIPLHRQMYIDDLPDFQLVILNCYFKYR